MEGTATVGRIVAPLLGAPGELHEQVARLGVAFQLTNLIRDVPLDWAMGRVYLPGLPERDRRGARAHRPPGGARPRAVRRDRAGGRRAGPGDAPRRPGGPRRVRAGAGPRRA